MDNELDFENINKVLVMLQESQDAEQDQRNKAREAKRFVYERDGQWDQESFDKMEGRYRGTFDMLSPIIEGIHGEIVQADFSLRTQPSDGRGTKNTAKTIDGLIRNIRNVSNADDVFNRAALGNIISGFDAVEVVQDWVDADAFDQDLFVKHVANAIDSVWFDLASFEPSRSDARWGVKLVAVPLSDYDATYPEGSGQSVGDNSNDNNIDKTNRDNKDIVTIGKIYYKKPKNIKLVQMTNGDVYRDDENFEKVQDELAMPTEENPQGITIMLDDNGKERRRIRKGWRVHSRMFDGSVWLGEEEETVFDFIPLVPIYGNFDIVENQCYYYGKIEKLYDQQRAMNYATSRDIEDGALSPSPTTWMTEDMAEGHDYSQMNTDRHPVRFYNVDATNPNLAPQFTGGPQPSVGLQTTIQNMQQMINASSNTFQAQQGNAVSTQSGIAGMQQIEQANVGSIKWFKALEVMICQVGKVLITGALSRVYDSSRQVRILEEDGTSSMAVLNQPVFDVQTQKNITLNDLSIGEYDILCEVGPAFNSSRKEAARAFEALMTATPELAARNMDIFLKNKSEPGYDLMAERERASLFNQGVIPESQWTDEEIAQVQQQQQEAANQPPQEDPSMVIARAEEGKAQAELQNSQTKQQEAQFNAQVKTAEVQLDQSKVDLEREKLQLDIAKFQREKDDKYNVDVAKIDQGQQIIDQKQQQIIIKAQQDQDKLEQTKIELMMKEQDRRFEQITKSIEQQQQQTNDAFTNLQKMFASMGVDSIVGQNSVEAYAEQVEVVKDTQNPTPDVSIAVVAEPEE